MEPTARKKENRKSVLCVVLINLFTLVLSAALFCPAAMNSDDIMINWLTGGAYGICSAATYENNVLFSALLILLQNTFGSVNFLAAIEYLVIFLCFTCCGVLIVRKKSGVAGMALALTFSLSLSPMFYCELQYTKIAALACAVGLALICFASQALQSRTICVLGVLLSAAACVMRFKAFLVGGFISFFFVGAYILFFRRYESLGDFLKENRRALVSYAFVLLAVLALWGVNERYYATDASAAFLRENSDARVAVSDYDLPDYSEKKAEYDALGLSENDLEIIRTWSFADYEKFTPDTLNAAAALGAPKTSESFIGGLKSDVLSSAFFWYSLLLCALGLVLSERRRFLFLIPPFAFAACFFVMSLLGRTTRWMTAGCVGALAFFSVLLFSARELKSSKVALVSASLLGAAALALYAVPKLVSGSESFRPDSYAIYDELSSDESLYLFDLSSMPAPERAQSPFSTVKRGMLKNIYPLGGWDSAGPAKLSVLEGFGVTGSPYRAWLSRDDVFLVDSINYQSKITYLRENYDESAGVSLYDTLDGYLVFAASEDLAGSALPADFAVTEISASPSALPGGFCEISFYLEHAPLSDSETLYLLFEDDASGDTLTLRARVLSKEGGLVGATLSVLYSELPFSSCTVRPVVRRADGSALVGDAIVLSL